MINWLLCMMGRHDWSRWYAGQRHCKRCPVLETRPYHSRTRVPVGEGLPTSPFEDEASIVGITGSTYKPLPDKGCNQNLLER